MITPDISLNDQRSLDKIGYNYHSLKIFQSDLILYINHCSHSCVNLLFRHPGVTHGIAYLPHF